MPNIRVVAIRWSQHWFDAVCKAVADEQITRKPVGEKGIILIQIENEYNHHGCDGKEKLLKALYSSVRKSGMDIPIFTCLTNECRSSRDPELSQVFDSDGLSNRNWFVRPVVPVRSKEVWNRCLAVSGWQPMELVLSFCTIRT